MPPNVGVLTLLRLIDQNLPHNDSDVPIIAKGECTISLFRDQLVKMLQKEKVPNK